MCILPYLDSTHAHIADPLYHLLQKGKRFQWKSEHIEAMKKQKEELWVPESLQKLNYNRPVVVTVDTSPTKIGWVINQENAEGD